MTAKILDGKALAAVLREEIRQQTERFTAGTGIQPGLAVVLVGDNPASRTYVTAKEKDCQECGFASFEYKLPAETTQAELMQLIDDLNADEKVDGILVQMPLPAHLSEKEVLCAIAPEKDVDGFHPMNVGRMTTGDPAFEACTPAGIMVMLKEYGIDVSGKRCVVLGRSNIVGKPMASMLLRADGTVTICHSKTPDMAAFAREADILVTAVGKVGLITADMVKDGAVVIDVAMNRNAEGKLCGDVDYAGVAPKTSFITPVPGGVGPMTRAMLMVNLLRAAQWREEG